MTDLLARFIKAAEKVLRETERHGLGPTHKLRTEDLPEAMEGAFQVLGADWEARGDEVFDAGFTRRAARTPQQMAERSKLMALMDEKLIDTRIVDLEQQRSYWRLRAEEAETLLVAARFDREQALRTVAATTCACEMDFEFKVYGHHPDCHRSKES